MQYCQTEGSFEFIITTTDHEKVMKIYMKTKQNYVIIVVIITWLAVAGWLTMKNVDHQSQLDYCIVISLH